MAASQRHTARTRRTAVVVGAVVLLAAATILLASALSLFPRGGHSGPRLVYADVGTISITSVTDLGGGSFSASGTWDPSGSLCWTPEGGGTFHYYIELWDDPDGSLPVTGTLLNTVNPGPCNGDYTSPVASGDSDLGGNWPGSGQGGNTFALGPGDHHICAILRHVNPPGGDVGFTEVCFDQTIIGPTPTDTPTPTATETPTATPTSQRPYSVIPSVQNHYPSPAVSGAEKTWVVVMENVGSQYGCDTSPVFGLQVDLTGQAPSKFSYSLGGLPCHDQHVISVSSLVTAPPAGSVSITACQQGVPNIGGRCAYASDSVVAAPTPTSTLTSTSTPTPTATPTPRPAEQCGDGIDNDGDGLIDGADPDCPLGGSGVFPDVAESGGSSGPRLGAVMAAVAAAVSALGGLGGAAWRARRRRNM